VLLVVESIGCGNIHWLPVEHAGVNSASWSQIYKLWENPQITCGTFYLFSSILA